jgi:hypothetical protein
MNLEEKFKEIIFNYDYSTNTMTQSAKECVQICDDFAVGFAEWCVSKEKLDIVHDLILIGELNRNYTTTELLEIYKQGL